jgi:hypothetical protein
VLVEHGLDVVAHRLVEGAPGAAFAGRLPLGRGCGQRGRTGRDPVQIEAPGIDGGRVRHERRALHDIGEFPNVARPRVAEQAPPRIGRQGARGQTVLAARPGEKVLGEDDDVSVPLAEGGQGQGHHREPVVHVLAKPPLAYLGGQIRVGRAEDPGVDRFAPRGPQPAHRAIFEDLEQLGLEHLAQQSDLIEKERPPVGGLEQTGLRLARLGEGAALVAEQLRLEQGFGDGRAVHVDEGPAGPGAHAVEQPGHQPLAGPGLAGDEHRWRAGRGPARLHQAPDAGAQGLDGRAGADQLAELVHEVTDCRTRPGLAFGTSMRMRLGMTRPALTAARGDSSPG